MDEWDEIMLYQFGCETGRTEDAAEGGRGHAAGGGKSGNMMESGCGVTEARERAPLKHPKEKRKS